MHFVEEGSDRQASTLLRMMAVAVRVLEREEEELKASEHEEEAGSARYEPCLIDTLASIPPRSLSPPSLLGGHY